MTGIIAGSAVGIAAIVIALLLIIVSIAIYAAIRRSKWSSLNRSYASVHSGSAQLLTSTEVPYDYVRSSPFFQGPDGLITKKNSAYQPTHVEMVPNIVYRNKTALNCHNPLTESLLQSNEYAYIGQHT